MTKLEHQAEAVQTVDPFNNIEDEAEYWDTHSALDAIAEGKVLGFHRARKTNSLTIRFEPSDIQRIREEAGRLGIGPSTLARMWILEHLHEGQGRRSIRR